MLQDVVVQRPFAGAVGDEGDMLDLARRRDDGVAPIGLPAVVEIVQQPHRVAVNMHDQRNARAIIEAERDRRPALDAKQRVAAIGLRDRAVEGPGAAVLSDREVDFFRFGEFYLSRQ